MGGFQAGRPLGSIDLRTPGSQLALMAAAAPG